MVTDSMYAVLTGGGTTTWMINSFPTLSKRGDRPFQIVRATVKVVAAGPLLYQVRLYNPDGSDNVASSGVQLCGTVPSVHAVRPLAGQNVWFPGNSDLKDVLVAIDCLKPKAGYQTPENIAICTIRYKMAPTEVQGVSLQQFPVGGLAEVVGPFYDLEGKEADVPSSGWE